MRPHLFLLLFMILASCAQQQKPQENKNLLPTSLVSIPVSANGVDSAVAGNKPTMNFKDTMHDFGTLHEGEVAEHSFEFTNNGKTPLIISSASASCGCTVADYDRNPILPGKKSSIKVRYNSANRTGHQEKYITITTNTSRGTEMVYIKTDIIGKK